MRIFFQTVWELLLPIQAPWQQLLVLFLAMPFVPWFILRVLPWLSVLFLQMLLFLIKFVTQFLSFFEYKVSQYIRKRKKKVPELLYRLTDALSASISLTQFLKEKGDGLSIITRRIPWVFHQKAWYALPLIILPIWFVRPYITNNGIATLVDNSVNWWCGLEHWIMAGEWTGSNLTCHYPDSNPKWNSFFKSREYELKRKIQQYTKEIERQVDNPILYYNRGTAQLNLEDINAAFEDYTASINSDKNYASAYVGRGDIYLIKGDEKAAFSEYFKAVTANPKYPAAYVGRGHVYLAMKDNASAFKEYSTAVKLDSNYAPGYVGRGEVYQIIGDKNAALREYKKALQINSDYVTAYAKIANLYYANFDNREAAINEYEKAKKIARKTYNITLYYEINQNLMALNRYTIHQVKSGDYLSKIARSYNVSASDIISSNRETYPTLVTNPNRIEVGWKLKIPQ